MCTCFETNLSLLPKGYPVNPAMRIRGTGLIACQPLSPACEQTPPWPWDPCTPVPGLFAVVSPVFPDGTAAQDVPAATTSKGHALVSPCEEKPPGTPHRHLTGWGGSTRRPSGKNSELGNHCCFPPDMRASETRVSQNTHSFEGYTMILDYTCL